MEKCQGVTNLTAPPRPTEIMYTIQHVVRLYQEEEEPEKKKICEIV